MARRKKGKAISGVVLLNKPAEMTSNSALQKVRRIFYAQKAGHTGALDPFATGLLPICLGESTKTSGLLLDSNKRYQAHLVLGVETDSGDKDGQTISTQQVPVLSQETIEAVLSQFVGDQMQTPPMYSALKVNGKPLYEYARAGIILAREPRPITVFELTLHSFDESSLTFEVFCSKGTYVRTLGEDIAKALGTVGHLQALHRTQIGKITAEKMHTLEQISENPERYLLPVDYALMDLPALTFDASQTDHLKHGGFITVSDPFDGFLRLLDETSRCFGVGEWWPEKQAIKPKRLFVMPESLESGS